ncbi:RNase H family protein [Glutamicibacter endophyticus]|uniref:RNase H family protein n=1 Tax=Glutamicibacter endophyticus TaxID=1522174 RepID=UPI003AF18F12
MTIIAAADGSALGNPGPAGWAWYIDDDNWGAGGWDHGTNNMGELKAVLELLRATARQPEQPLRILCDSQYAINCITKWMPGWKKRGWKKADGKPVLNQDILRELDAALVGRDYSFEWVKGHAGHELNEAADERARAAATAHQLGVAPEPGPGFRGGEEASGEPAREVDAVAEEPGPVAAGQPAPSAEATAIVYELELAMLDEQVRAKTEELLAFLHPGYQEISRDGSLLDVATLRGHLAGGGQLPAVGQIQLLALQEPAADTVLVAYRMRPTGTQQVLVVSSWWQRTAAGWKLRFRQETVESLTVKDAH